MPRPVDADPVLIAGAGIGGLTAALALQRAGRRVIVFETADELGDVGAGLTLASNGAVVLRSLGLGKVLDEFAVMPARGAVLHFRDGRTLVDIPRGPATEHHGAPYCQIHRADLHAGLAEAVRAGDADSIRLGHTLVDFQPTRGGVTARFANGNEAWGAALIGCDGIRSAVRARLFGPDEPRFTGYVAWRGLVPIDRLPPGLVEPESAVWIGPGHFLTRYKIRRGRLVNYVGIARAGTWTEEGWSVRSSVAEVLAEFADFEPGARALLEATPPELCYKWGIFDREPLSRWTEGPVSLLGDAAHPMTPFLGQGAVMALEDAAILGRAFALEGSPVAALCRYEAARRPRTTAVFLASRDNGEQLTCFDPDAYTPAVHANEESLGLAAYNAVTVPF